MSVRERNLLITLASSWLSASRTWPADLHSLICGPGSSYGAHHAPDRLASPAFAHPQDWTILEDGETVGRFYESVGKPPEYRWFWSMILLADRRSGIVTNGSVASFEEAKARFRESLAKARAHDPV
jgi:hypothetical protein